METKPVIHCWLLTAPSNEKGNSAGGVPWYGNNSGFCFQTFSNLRKLGHVVTKCNGKIFIILSSIFQIILQSPWMAGQVGHDDNLQVYIESNEEYYELIVLDFSWILAY